MQLQPGEKSVLAYFENSVDAESAVQALKQAGAEHVQLDNITPYFKHSSNLSSSLSYLTGSKDNPEMYRSYGSLMAANTDGISSITAQPRLFYVVTVVTNGSQIETVNQILQSYGANI